MLNLVVLSRELSQARLMFEKKQDDQRNPWSQSGLEQWLNSKDPQYAGVEVMTWGISRDLRWSQLDAVQLTRIMTEIEKIESSRTSCDDLLIMVAHVNFVERLDSNVICIKISYRLKILTITRMHVPPHSKLPLSYTKLHIIVLIHGSIPLPRTIDLQEHHANLAVLNFANVVIRR